MNYIQRKNPLIMYLPHLVVFSGLCWSCKTMSRYREVERPLNEATTDGIQNVLQSLYILVYKVQLLNLHSTLKCYGMQTWKTLMMKNIKKNTDVFAIQLLWTICLFQISYIPKTSINIFPLYNNGHFVAYFLLSVWLKNSVTNLAVT